MSSVSKSTFSKYCRNISSYSSADTLKTFSFKKKGKQITKLVYYPENKKKGLPAYIINWEAFFLFSACKINSCKCFL